MKYNKNYLHVFSLLIKCQVNSGSLCCKLTVACPKRSPRILGTWKKLWELDQSSIIKQNRQLDNNFGDLWKGMCKVEYIIFVCTVKSVFVVGKLAKIPTSSI